MFISKTKEKLPKSILILIQIILNNLIAITIHVCIYILFIIPIFLLFLMSGSSVLWIAIGVYTLTALFLYFLAGKLFLSNTHNTLTNIFSVLVLVIILIATTYILEGWVNVPFYPLFELISFIFQIPYGASEDIYIYLSLAPLPSLTMLAGLIAKQRRDKLNKKESHTNENLQSVDGSFEDEEDTSNQTDEKRK